MVQLANRNYGEAGKELEELLMHHPDARYLEDASYRLAVCDYARGQFDAADARLAALLKAHPESGLAAGAWLTRVLLRHPDLSGGEREACLDRLLQPGSITNGSPAVLQAMLDGAVQHGQTNLAVALAQDLSTEFSGDPAAAEALLRLGRMFREDGRGSRADKCYEAILAVAAWGKWWPEALYGRGLCAEAGQDLPAAAGHYERIFRTCATTSRDWTARAFLRCADCLHRAHEDGKARAALQEFLAADDLAQFPEYEQGRQLLARLEAQ